MKQLLITCFVMLASSLSLLAHGDEVPTDPGVSKDHFTAYGLSDRYELTLYYPEIEAGKEAHLTLFLADYKTNKPVDKAVLTITIPEKGTFEVTPGAPGVYEVHATFPEHKTYTLHVQVAHPAGADLIGIQEVTVGKRLSSDESATPTATAQNNQWLWFAGGIVLGGLLVWFVSRRRNRTLTVLLLLASAWLSPQAWTPVWGHDDHGPEQEGHYGAEAYVPKETQFLFEIQTMPVEVGDYHSATTFYGTIVPSSGGYGVVSAPQAGRVMQMKVAVGQTVKAGQTLALLRQNAGTPDEVNIAAANAALAVQLETAQVKLDAAKREYERLSKIADIAAGKDVQAAEAAWKSAQAEWQTLRNKAIGDNQSANNRMLALVAPISGVVGPFTLTAGAEVTAGQTLFNITNLGKVYVEAQVYDRDLGVVQAGNKFSVTCATDDHKSAEVRLISQAQIMNPGNQSQRVLFEMENPGGDFKIGEFVTIKALDARNNRQISVPNAALTEVYGKTAVFIKHAPETYELAYVQTGADDGARTLILKGIDEGEKIVINGTYEVKMMYLR